MIPSAPRIQLIGAMFAPAQIQNCCHGVDVRSSRRIGSMPCSSSWTASASSFVPAPCCLPVDRTSRRGFSASGRTDGSAIRDRAPARPRPASARALDVAGSSRARARDLAARRRTRRRRAASACSISAAQHLDAVRPPGQERMAGEHEEAAVAAASRRARSSRGRAPSPATRSPTRNGGSRQVRVLLPVVERPVHRQLDDLPRAGVEHVRLVGVHQRRVVGEPVLGDELRRAPARLPARAAEALRLDADARAAPRARARSRRAPRPRSGRPGESARTSGARPRARPRGSPRPSAGSGRPSSPGRRTSPAASTRAAGRGCAARRRAGRTPGAT